MAVRIVNMGSGGTQDALLKQLLEQYGVEATPKVSGLSRIMAPFTGIGSIIDAYYDARFQDKDPGILNVLKNYGQNVIQGFGTLATGKNYEPDLISRGIAETLDKAVPGFKYSKLGQSTAARMAMDVAAGLITDPTTFFSFGATSLADDVIKSGLKVSGLSDDIVEATAKTLSGSTLSDATKAITKELGPDVADKFYVNVLQNIGKGTAKSGALKLFGETITENPTAVKLAKGIVSPLGAATDQLSAASKKFAPGLRASVLDVFDPVQGAIEQGKGEEALNLLKFQRESSSLPESVLSEMAGAELLNKSGIEDEHWTKMPKYIEKSKETAYNVAQAGDVLKQKDDILKALKGYLKEGPGEVLPVLPEGQVGMFAGLEEEGANGLHKLVSRLGESESELGNIYRNLGPDQQQVLDELVARAQTLGGKKATSGNLSKLFNDTIGNYADKSGQLLSVPDNLPENVKDYISKYFNFERGYTKQMEALGIPTINPQEMGHMMRVPKGYRESIIKDTLNQSGMEGVYDKVMSNKKVLNEIKEAGYVSRDTLRKVLNDNEWAAFKRYDPGTLGEMISGGGATKERTFKTLEQAEAAGMVYENNPLENIYRQTGRQKGQILAANFAQDMVSNEDLFSKKATGILTTPVTVPGVGTFYTDKHMAKIADEYISKYTTQEGAQELLKQFDDIQRAWKKWVTGMGPNALVYHERNLIDDNIRLVVDGADMKHLGNDYELAFDMFNYQKLANQYGKDKAAKLVDQTRARKFLEEVGVDSDNPLEELLQRSLKNGVYSDYTKSMTEMDLGESPELRKALGIEGSQNIGKKGMQKYEDLMTAGGMLPKREQATRIATYLNNWRKEGAEAAGVDAVARVSFNYNELSKFERETLKRIIPFYGFVKNNLRFYMDLMKDNPEKLARYYNVYQGLQSGPQSLYGEEWQAMPDYVKESFAVPIGKTKEGDLKYLSGLNLGIENLGDITPDTAGLRRAAGNLSPELSMLIELATGKDLFTGEDILKGNQGYNYANMPDAIKKLINYQKYPVKLQGGGTYEKETMSPMWKYALENVPFVSTVNTSAKRLSKFRTKEGLIEGLTSAAFPVTISKVRIGDVEEKKRRKAEEDLYKLLQRKGLADVYESFYIPEGLKQQLLK